MKNLNKMGRIVLLIAAIIGCIVCCTSCAIRPMTRKATNHVATSIPSTEDYVTSETEEMTTSEESHTLTNTENMTQIESAETLADDFFNLHESLINLPAEEKEAFCLNLWRSTDNNHTDFSFKSSVDELCSELYLKSVPEDIAGYTPKWLKTMTYLDNKHCNYVKVHYDVVDRKFKNADFQYFSIFEFEEDNSVNIIHKINNNEFVEFSWFIVAPDGMRFSGLLWGGNLIFDDEFGNHSVVYSRNNNYFPEFMPLEDFIEKNPEVAEHEIMWAAD